MSRFTDFAQRQFAVARSVIGGEALTIGGGTAISAVLDNIATGRDEYADGGFPLVESATAVVSLTDWSAAYTSAATTYIGKVATLRGQSLRVERVSPGQGFVTIQLRTTRKGA